MLAPFSCSWLIVALATVYSLVMITQEYLKSRLDYDPDTGGFRWKYHSDVRPCRNSRYGGKLAGGINADGYIVIGVNGERHMAHRLAWL